MKSGFYTFVSNISKADGSQVLDLQVDALAQAGVEQAQIYSDRALGKRDDRPGLEACLKALREGDVLVLWKLDRLGRSLQSSSKRLMIFAIEVLASKSLLAKVQQLIRLPQRGD